MVPVLCASFSARPYTGAALLAFATSASLRSAAWVRRVSTSASQRARAATLIDSFVGDKDCHKGAACYQARDLTRRERDDKTTYREITGTLLN